MIPAITSIKPKETKKIIPTIAMSWESVGSNRKSPISITRHRTQRAASSRGMFSKTMRSSGRHLGDSFKPTPYASIPAPMGARNPPPTMTYRVTFTEPYTGASKAAYKDTEGFLILPGLNLKRSIVEGAKIGLKTKRGTGYSGAQMIRGSIYIEPQNPRLLSPGGRELKEYEVDTQIVKNPSTGGRMPCHRARIDEWRVDFSIKWNPHFYGLLPISVKECCEKAGYIGLCDYRPDYGIFRVTKFEARDE